MANHERELAGVLGFFDHPSDILSAMEKVRDANYKSFDAFTPFPVHGLEQAQGLKRSKIPYITFLAGITGCSLAFALQYWTSVVDWPLNVGGKPFNSWPAFVPVMFELTVLLAGLSTAFSMFIFNGLPNIKKRSFDPALTRDRFAIIIEAPAHSEHGEDDDDEEEGHRFKKFEASEAEQFLQQVGAKEVRKVYNEGWF